MSKQKYVIIFFCLRAIWATILAGAMFSCDLNDDGRKYDGESKLSKIKALEGSYTAAADEDAISLEADQLPSAVSVAELLGTVALRDIGLQDFELELRADDSTGTLVLTIYPDGIQPPDGPNNMVGMVVKTIHIRGFRAVSTSQESTASGVTSELNDQVAQSYEEEVPSMDIRALGLGCTKRASEISASDLPSALTENLQNSGQRLELLPHDSAGELYLLFFYQDIPDKLAEIYVVKGFRKGPAVKVEFSPKPKNLYHTGDELPISVKVQNLRENSYLKHKYRKSGVMADGLPVFIFLGSDLVCVLAFPWETSETTKSPESRVYFVKDIEDDHIYESSLTLETPKFIDKSELKIATKAYEVRYAKPHYEVNFQFGYKMHLKEIIKFFNIHNKDKTGLALKGVYAEYYRLCKNHRGKYPSLDPNGIKNEMLKEYVTKCQKEIEQKEKEIEAHKRHIKKHAKLYKWANLCFKVITYIELACSAASVLATGGATLPAFLTSLTLNHATLISDKITKDGKVTDGDALSMVVPVKDAAVVDALELRLDGVVTENIVNIPAFKAKEGGPGLAACLGSGAKIIKKVTFDQFLPSPPEPKSGGISKALMKAGSRAKPGFTMSTFASAALNFACFANSKKMAKKAQRLEQEKQHLEFERKMLEVLENDPGARDIIIACEEGKAQGKVDLKGDEFCVNDSYEMIKEELDEKMKNNRDPLDKGYRGRLYNIMSCQCNGKEEFIYQTIKYYHKESGARINNYADHFYKLNERGEIIYRASGEKVDNVLDMYGDHYPGLEHRTNDEVSAEIVDYTNELLDEHPEPVNCWSPAS